MPGFFYRLLRRSGPADKFQGTGGQLDAADQEILNRLKVRGALISASTQAIGVLFEKHQNAPTGILRTVQEFDFASSTAKPKGPAPLAASAEEIAAATKYRLIATDTFVEKAQFHLGDRADLYRNFGVALFIICLGMLGLGAWIAISSYLEPAPAPTGWLAFTYRFTVAFTAYGLLVAAAAAAGKGAKACFDQSERLLAKRHALRHGRLFLHLRGGLATSSQMKEAFDWNHFQPNAFTHLNMDAKAPWGNVVEEIIKIVPELVKTGVEAASKPERKPEEK